MNSDKYQKRQEESDVFSQSGLNSLLNGDLQENSPVIHLRNRLPSLEYAQIDKVSEIQEVMDHWREKITEESIKMQCTQINEKKSIEKMLEIQKFLQNNPEIADDFYQLLNDKEILDKLHDLHKQNLIDEK